MHQVRKQRQLIKIATDLGHGFIYADEKESFLIRVIRVADSGAAV
jgi:hypothetical protein